MESSPKRSWCYTAPDRALSESIVPPTTYHHILMSMRPPKSCSSWARPSYSASHGLSISPFGWLNTDQTAKMVVKTVPPITAQIDDR